MPEEKLIHLDLSDALALIERQKGQIAALEAQVKEKDEQIEAAMFSGTQGEIIKMQKEQIAALKADIETWKEGALFRNSQIAALTAELIEVKQSRESAWKRIDELGNQVIDLSFKLKETETKRVSGKWR